MSPLQEVIGLRMTFFIPVAICAIALLSIATIYVNPPEPAESDKGSSDPTKGKLTPYEFWGVVLSGCVWCLYNVAFILPLSFGPEFLVTKSITLTSAGAIVSLASWLIIPALPLGAWAAKRIGRPCVDDGFDVPCDCDFDLDDPRQLLLYRDIFSHRHYFRARGRTNHGFASVSVEQG